MQGAVLRPAVVDGVDLWRRREVQADSIKRVALTQVWEVRAEGFSSAIAGGGSSPLMLEGG